MSTRKGRLKKPYPPINKNADLVSTDKEKAEVLDIFALVFTGNLSPHPS